MPRVKSPRLYLVAVDIRSLYNVGALFRNCDAFGVAKLYLCGYSGTPPRKEISKTALGAENSVPWEYQKLAVRLMKQLRADGIRIVALERVRGSTTLFSYHPKFPLALVVGNEVEGIPRTLLRLADDVVSIPMSGKKESLNVAVAAGVAMYALTAATSRPAA